MLTNEEVESFIAHYHRHEDQIAAAKHAREGLTDRQASDFAARVLQTPRGQRELIKVKREAATFAPMKDYIAKLEEIRDAAIDAGKFGPAVQAHMVIGKLAGHFDRPEADPGAVGDASQLSTDELLRRIEHLTNQKRIQVIEVRPEKTEE